MLILGGQNDYNYGKIFKSVSKSKYDTNCQNTESSLFRDVTYLHDQLSKNFNKSDFKIMFLHRENARRGIKISEQELGGLKNSSRQTNAILVGVPLTINKKILNQLISHQYKITEECTI